MDSVKQLAETNLLISEAKNLLFQAKKEEANYILEREALVSLRIGKLYQESSEMLQNTKQNYSDVQTILILAKEATKFLQESYEGFSKLIKEFKESNEEWEKKVSSKEEDFINLKKAIEIDKVAIANEKRNLENIKILMEQDRRKIKDDRETLERGFLELKKLKAKK